MIVIKIVDVVVLTIIVIDFGIRVFSYAESGNPAYKHEHFVVLKNIWRKL